ncbi:hypothetical protein [Butyrivibrio sp. AD3002]|uniref:hypothetical protein n=2 Tax=unclassified Butyrivibrio TaxID=2639466 RepID=UPI0003B327A5|nr:hypothetical protein [Butyrivibrio sp. AD3002]
MKKRIWVHILILATLSLLALIPVRRLTGTKYSYSKDDFIGLINGGSGINRSDKIEDTSVLAIVKMNGNVLKTEWDYIDFMVDTYGFEASDFDNMDIIQFVTDFSLDTQIASREDAWKIYKYTADIYQYTDMTRMYNFIYRDTNESVQKGDTIVKIGYYFNEGTFAQSSVFDITEGVFYVDDLTAHNIPDGVREELKTFAERYHLDEWNKIPVDEPTDPDSTANYAWRLVFVTESGNTCSYYGGLGYTDPKGSYDAMSELTAMIETI